MEVWGHSWDFGDLEWGLGVEGWLGGNPQPQHNQPGPKPTHNDPTAAGEGRNPTKHPLAKHQWGGAPNPIKNLTSCHPKIPIPTLPTPPSARSGDNGVCFLGGNSSRCVGAAGKEGKEQPKSLGLVLRGGGGHEAPGGPRFPFQGFLEGLGCCSWPSLSPHSGWGLTIDALW